MSKTFQLVVEEEPKLDLAIPCDFEGVPDIVVHNGEMFMLVGRYLSQGDRYRYRRPTVLEL